MAIKINNPEERESIVFDKLHLEEFKLHQPVNKNGIKSLIFKTFNYGLTESGKWEHNPLSRFEFKTLDFDSYAIELYMKQTGKSLEESLNDYKEIMSDVENANILEIMAYFQKGISLIYEEEKSKRK
jgi:hypothetical protein